MKRWSCRIFLHDYDDGWNAFYNVSDHSPRFILNANADDINGYADANARYLCILGCCLVWTFNRNYCNLPNELVARFDRLETWHAIEKLKIKKRDKNLGKIINKL